LTLTFTPLFVKKKWKEKNRPYLCPHTGYSETGCYNTVDTPDFYGSLGPAYRNNKNYNRNYHTASDSLLRSRHVNLSDATVKSYLEENSRVIIRPALGIRLGYRL